MGPWLQPYTISTCASSGSPSVRLRSSIGTSIGRSLFLCKWSSSTSFSPQSNPTLEQECSSACFLGTCAMLAFGYSGEAHFLNAWAGFLFGLAGWAFILFEIFAGEAGKESAALGGNVKTAFDIMKFIVTVGWSIYPLGYFFGYLQSGVDDSTLNLVYNLADFVNKIAFCLAIWNCAKNDTAENA